MTARGEEVSVLVQEESGKRVASGNRSFAGKYQVLGGDEPRGKYAMVRYDGLFESRRRNNTLARRCAACW